MKTPRINLILLILWPAFCLSGESFAQEVVEQKPVAKYACGACAIYNALNNSGEDLKIQLDKLAGETPVDRVKTIVDEFCSKPSLVKDGKQRFAKEDMGISPEDLVAVFNDTLEATGHDLRVTGLFLNRREQESYLGNLTRIHSMFRASLDQGLPVVFSVRSFVAAQKEDKSKFIWNGLRSHYVVVSAVQPELRDNEKGFSFEYLDSNSGKHEFGYINIDEARNFTAARGDSQTWEWLRDRPFAVVTGPSLRLQTHKQGFHQRTIITANYAIVPQKLAEDFERRVFSTTVEASCGQCQLEMEGKGCTLAIRHNGLSYFLEGSDIDSHGDAHGEDGFCNCVRKATVSGKIEDGKFVVEKFLLLPLPKKKDE